MKEVTRRIELDLSRKNNTRVSFASEADFGSREFIITILDDGIPYPVDKSMTATVNVCRADGTSSAYIVEITDDRQIRYVASLWALSVPGDTRFSVSLYDGEDKKLTTPFFTVCVEEGLYLGNDIQEGDETHTVFTDMINSVAQFEVEEAKRAAAEQERINNESIRVGSELGRTEAEDKRSVAENARVNNENARIEAENARISNEEKRILNENARMQVTDTLMQALAHLITLQEQYIAKGETA